MLNHNDVVLTCPKCGGNIITLKEGVNQRVYCTNNNPPCSFEEIRENFENLRAEFKLREIFHIITYDSTEFCVTRKFLLENHNRVIRFNWYPEEYGKSKILKPKQAKLVELDLIANFKDSLNFTDCTAVLISLFESEYERQMFLMGDINKLKATFIAEKCVTINPKIAVVFTVEPTDLQDMFFITSIFRQKYHSHSEWQIIPKIPIVNGAVIQKVYYNCVFGIKYSCKNSHIQGEKVHYCDAMECFQSRLNEAIAACRQ